MKNIQYYYYYLDAIIFTRKYLLRNVNYYSGTSSVFAKYFLKTQQQILIPMGENYELALSNLTHLYTPITIQQIYVLLSTPTGKRYSRLLIEF